MENTVSQIVVSIVMGSISDQDVMNEAAAILKAFEVPFEMRVISAHRTPAAAHEYASTARQRGLRIIIGAAGKAAHLAGVIAASTTLPVLGVPMPTSDLGGLDSLLSMVQMPGGIPVPTFAIGKAGAKNAALSAVAILALNDERLSSKLVEYRRRMAAEVEEQDRRLQQSN